MVKIRIVKSRLKHDLFFIPSLIQIVLSYCQYKDAKKLYKDWKCHKPAKLILFLREYDGDLSKIIPSFEETLYIANETEFKLDLTLFNILVTINKIIKWQCPSCKKYSNIGYQKYDGLDTVVTLKKSTFFKRGSPHLQSIICECIVINVNPVYKEKCTILDLDDALNYHYNVIKTQLALQASLKRLYNTKSKV